MRKFLKRVFSFGFFVTIIGAATAFSFYAYSKISPKLELKSANNISLFDKSEELFFRGNGSGEWVGLNEIAPVLIDATVSLEDKKFYGHYGFDIPRIFKALYKNFTTGTKKEGASTISQQYAKNLYLDFDKSWSRKWDEMWLTLNIETHYEKEDILEGYLNTINYGHGMYGIENASNFYFGKKSSELSLAEASILVGIPKSPSYYSPLINFDLAKERQGLVLYSMVNNDYITEDEMVNAYNEELIFFGKKSTINLSTIMYYQDAVMKELASIKSIPISFLDTGGLRVYTNLDIGAQTLLEEKMIDNLKNNSDIQTSGIIMDPKTGGIMALIGGRDYSTSQYNRAVQSVRQVGSAIKPLLYYAALENGFTSSTAFTSEATTFTFSNNKTYSPRNASEVYGNKPISLAAAIAYSDNIYAVKTHIFLGEDALVNMGNRLGIASSMQPIPSLALGTSELNMIEFTSAYAAFANEGYKVNPHFITRVEDINGNVLYEVDDTKEIILNSSLVFILNDLLTTTYDSNFIDYSYPTILNEASKLSKKYSVKSGSTATDSWTIGYNPDVVISVWCGYDDNSDILLKDYVYTKDIWAETIEGYLKDKEESWYTMPANVVGVLVNPISGKPVKDKEEKKKIMYYLRGTEPTGEEAVFDEKDKY